MLALFIFSFSHHSGEPGRPPRRFAETRFPGHAVELRHVNLIPGSSLFPTGADKLEGGLPQAGNTG